MSVVWKRLIRLLKIFAAPRLFSGGSTWQRKNKMRKWSSVLQGWREEEKICFGSLRPEQLSPAAGKVRQRPRVLTYRCAALMFLIKTKRRMKTITVTIWPFLDVVIKQLQSTVSWSTSDGDKRKWVQARRQQSNTIWFSFRVCMAPDQTVSQKQHRGLTPALHWKRGLTLRATSVLH